MSKRYRPLTSCDRDCAAANGCGAMGGVECPDCGCLICQIEGDEDGRCDDCAERHRRAQESEEDELQEQEAEDGE